MDEKIFLIKLLLLEGVGRVKIKKLIDRFKNPETILGRTSDEIAAVGGLTLSKARAVLDLANTSDRDALKLLSDTRKSGYNILFYGNKDYPSLLKEIYDPPIIIYVDGELRESDFNAVSVVGTRRATEYGRTVARLISKTLVANNITVISGCALGIDTAAHRGALEGGGRTIAVLGSGLNCRYPESNFRLMDEISHSGAVISEFNLDEKPLAHNFPLRNRIISGLSLGVVVVEAPEKSGALITAYSALEQGRQVFAVPGSIFSSKSSGCNELIKNGAVPVINGVDIIREIEPLINKRLAKQQSEEFLKEKVSQAGTKILKFLGSQPIHIDTLKIQSKMNIKVLTRELTALEILGRVKQVGGKRYIKK